MSCSLIEAKFQVLDRTIKMLSKSKKLRTPRVASSDQLRELVETQKPTSLLPTIKPVKDVVVTRSNQTQSSINRGSRSQPNTSREDKSEKKYGPPRPSTGRRDPHKSSTELVPEKWIDPKQKRAEQLLQDTWNEIESVVNWRRDTGSRSREVPRSKLLNDNYRDEGLEQDSNPREERIQDQHASNQIHDDAETISAAVHNALPPPKRPLTSAGSHPKKSKAYLRTRCRSALFNCSDSQPKNWFAPSAVGITETAPKTKRKDRPRTAIGKHMKENQKSVEPPSPPRPEVEPTPRSVEVEVAPDWEGESSPPVPNPVPNADDPSFYMLELRLVHPEPLMNWRFQASFTDTSVDPPKTVILDDLTADDENCLLFDDPRLAQGSTPSRYFNPFLYFPGLSRPSDLYGHALRIIVTSLQPVTRIVINTSVQFTRFPDEAVVKPPVQSIRQHSENVDNYLRVLPRRNKSASSASRRGVKVSKLGKKKIPRPPPQNTNHESSTSSLAMDQCNPWSSSEQNDIDADDHQDSMLKQMFTLQLDEPRPPSPTTPTRKSPTTENLGRSPRTPMATIDKKKMQLQRLRANIRREMSEQKIDNCNL
ncbi:hypothetical protein JG687_00007777 [Phytophthora cactorum]|uniref:Uncharacterized protein n=1 Tax=Phytophthora cactorum TaxID=29920 RepID=A0A8T1UHC6_9STRA|nr:hypothetical protein PC120_g15037 [Phytophthora cactorum]KAG3054600.1 hypothetical protein PC121_g16215 [Phytophthora cactorum]KAG3175915.1 hypothetical protein PC128_g17512 [Phytophthora cactorum]KAG4049558.1 hypothetical protein PC123_g15173 [Phytophthora cactorum]KAG6961272.1 hypothetical protein JG687_00007777 [Phytophthora cactorum]